MASYTDQVRDALTLWQNTQRDNRRAWNDEARRKFDHQTAGPMELAVKGALRDCERLDGELTKISRLLRA